MLNGKTALLAAFLLLALAACSPGNAENITATEEAQGEAVQGVYQTLAIDELANIIQNEADAYTIINVHIPYAGEIEGTDANIAFNDLDALTEALPDKDAPIILYCRSGSMSEQATRALLEQGYTQVWDVPGGMNAWQASGRELVSR